MRSLIPDKSQMPIRPKPTSQAGRILQLLESANGAKVFLPEILALRISQYGARIFELRHKYGLRIENGSAPGRPDHTWFRLIKDHPSDSSSVPIGVNDGNATKAARSEPQGLAGLFTEAELQRTAGWRDEG